MRIRYGTACSGIEAPSVAWEGLGWEAAWFSEIEANPCKLLKTHYPSIENIGNMNKIPLLIGLGELEAPEVFIAGTPCQSFSVAGLKKGLADPRGGLTLKYVQIINAIDEERLKNGEEPTIAIWENVPGVLSSKDNAFGCFLAALSDEDEPFEQPTKGGKQTRWPTAGYINGSARAVAWRVLDAQYFGVAQRRRRVFVVASARDRFSVGRVLFELEGMRRDSPPSRKKGENPAATLTRGFRDRGVDADQIANGNYAISSFALSSFAQYSDGLATLKASGGDIGGGSEVLNVTTYDMKRHHAPEESETTSLTTKNCQSTTGNTPIVQETYCTQGTVIGRKDENGPQGCGYSHEVSFTLNRTDEHAVAFSTSEVGPTMGASGPPYSRTGNERVETEALAIHGTRVRRLTPLECERLQGFPDDYTKAAGLTNTARYKALGNSMAVPVIKWLGLRVEKELIRCARLVEEEEL